jgi:FkbM family methyltransferase
MLNAQHDPLFQLLTPERLTAVVDIGANPIDAKPPYKQMLERGLCTVTGFEPQAGAFAELERHKGPFERYLPLAVGDGTERMLRVCVAQGMTSLLRPDPERLALFNDFPKLGRINQEIAVQTHRLDDVEAIEHLDFLKIDIQGCELDVFRSGQLKLAKTVFIQTEISFVPLYLNQPAIGAIDVALRGMGFLPHCFAELKKWPLAPAVIGGNRRKPLHQLLEADLVYVRDFTRPDKMDGEQWKHVAMIAHHCYRSFDLVLLAIRAAAVLGVLSPDAPQKYLDIVAQRNSKHALPSPA